MDLFKIILVCVLVTLDRVVIATENTTTVAPKSRSIKLQYATSEVLECHVTKETKNQAFTLTWFRGNYPISKKKFTGITSEKSIYTLKLTNQPEATGAYHCEITDASGRLSSNSVLVNRDKPYLKLFLPEVKPAPMSLRINESSKTAFYVKCIVSSFPRANLTFSGHQQSLTSQNDRVHVNSTEDGDTVTYVLTIRDVTYRDASEYRCRASNGILSETITANVIHLKGQECSEELLESKQQFKCPTNDKCVSSSFCRHNIHECIKYNCERPDQPKNARIVGCTHNAAEIKWERDEKAEKYIVFVDTSGMLTYSLQTVGSDIIASGLVNDKEYTFTVSANNRVGMSEEVKMKCKTKRMQAPTSVQKSRVDHHRNGMSFNWDLPEDDGISKAGIKNTGTLSYRIKYCPQIKDKTGQVDTTLCKSFVTNSTSIPIEIADIKRNYTYKFTVWPVNTGGMSGKAHIMYYHMPTKLTSSAQSLTRGSGLLLVIIASILASRVFCE